MDKIKALFFVIVLVIVGCSIQKDKLDLLKDFVPREENQDLEVYFCPKENCSLHLTEFIGSAEEYVHCAFFDLDLKEIMDELASKSKEIDVKLVIDDNNYDGSIKGSVVVDTPNQLSHNKFCVVDGKKISTGSFNPTERGAFYNNNNLVIINSEYLAKNFEDEFNELWASNFSKGGNVEFPVIYFNNKMIENYFCPEDNCAEHVIDALNKAEESIYFMTFSFTKEEIADSILFKDVDVRGVFETTQAGSKYSQLHRLSDFGLDVKKDHNKYNMHHKVFIIDNKTVVTGSFNPTNAGDNKNDENVLIIHDKDVAKRFLEEFEDVWG